jgi:hypothetical protein
VLAESLEFGIGCAVLLRKLRAEFVVLREVVTAVATASVSWVVLFPPRPGRFAEFSGLLEVALSVLLPVS